jgi:O-antigen/teichoic acid export membrane protein
VLPLAREGLPYLLMAIFAVIYYRINAVMLSLLSPEVVVGWFGAAFRFFDILMFLPSILSMAVFPVLARSSGNKEAVTLTTVRSLETILLAAIPIAVGTFAFAHEIIAILFGAREFAGSVVILQTLAPGLVLVYIDFVLVTALIATDHQRPWSLVALGAIPVSIALNIFLIPYFQQRAGNGGIGSAIATNLTEFGILVAALWLLPKGFFPRERNWRLAKTLLAGAVMYGSIWLLRMGGVPWPIQAAGGCIAYVAAIFGTGVTRPEERAFAFALMSPAGMKRLFVRNTPSQA